MAKSPGPVPQNVRRRRNKDIIEKVKGQRRGRTVRAHPNPEWRMDVRNFFNAHLESGQADFYENSDLMALYIQCELLDRVLRGSRTVPVYEEYMDDKGKWHKVLDEDGNPIPLLDPNGEPERRTVGSINGQALKAILDMGQDLLSTEGARRRLRIDLGFPNEDEEDVGKAIVAQQKKSVAMVG